MAEPLEILLVDDEPMIARSLSRYLELMNCRISVCHDSDQAARTAKSKTFDAIVADFDLPGTDGIALLKQCRQSNPSCRLIVATGDSGLLDNRASEDLSGITVLTKPFDLDALMEAIRKPLDAASEIKSGPGQAVERNMLAEQGGEPL